jgi:hypothetical protein
MATAEWKANNCAASYKMLLEGCGDTFLLRLCGIAARCELITAEKLVEYHGLGTSAESKLDLAAISKELADCLDKASSPLKKKFCNDCTAIVSRCSGQSSCKCSGRGSEGKACGYTDLVSKLCQALLDGARTQAGIDGQLCGDLLPFQDQQFAIGSNPSAGLLSTVYCSSHYDESFAARETELLLSIQAQRSKVRAYLSQRYGKEIKDRDFERLFRVTSPSILILRVGYNSVHFREVMGLDKRNIDVICLSDKGKPTLVYGCSKCNLGQLVKNICKEVVCKVKHLQLQLEEITRLEEYVFLNPGYGPTHHNLDFLSDFETLQKLASKPTKYLQLATKQQQQRLPEILQLVENLKPLCKEFAKCMEVAETESKGKDYQPLVGELRKETCSEPAYT